MERRLAAILAADVVGYSRLVGVDEEGTLLALKSLRTDIIEPLIADHRGRVVKLMGDGILVEFQSAADAVKCAVDWQEQLMAQKSERKLTFRIGINLGDVVIDGDDILGDGVNIAARLEGSADPGGIAVSDTVKQNVAANLDLPFVDQGVQTLKNISEPVRVWTLGDAGSLSHDFEQSKPPSNKPSIAVLPFKNLSGDPDQDYFSDGLTEDLITAISYWRTFPVIARNSTFSFKGRSAKAADIGTELGAKYLLEGSVRKSGSRIRVTASLIDAARELELWGERFDRDVVDIFDVQDEITARVAAVVGHQIEQAELVRVSESRSSDVTAWDLVVRGIPHFLEHSCQGNQSARRYFQQATERANDYSDAWAYLAWTHSHDLMMGCPVDRDEAARLGLRAGKRAVSLNDASALAHLALSSVFVWTGDAKNGLAQAQRARELNPNDVRASFAVGNRLTLTGELEQGIEIIEAAMILNPRDPYRWHYFGYLSRAYLSLGDPARATEWAQRAVQMKPDQADTHFRLALCHAHSGLIDETREELSKSEALDPGFVERKKAWTPYPSEERNEQLLAPLRAEGLL